MAMRQVIRRQLASAATASSRPAISSRLALSQRCYSSSTVSRLVKPIDHVNTF